MPALPEATGDLASLNDVSARVGGRSLFSALDLRIGRQRLAVVGPNGAGKTTLLEILLGRRAPSTGTASRDLARIGSIAQGGIDWMLDESLLAHLAHLAQRAMTSALRAWPGGLVVTSHDRAFLSEIGVSDVIELAS